MRRFVPAAIALAALLPLGLAPGVARAQGEPQTLVDRATLALQEMMTQTVSQDPRIMLQRARAVMICPRVFKAGFILGGSGGDCVLLARAGNGTWSYPAFYGLGSGSFGFQIGVQDSAIFMMIMTGRGLNAVMDSQFKLGGDVSGRGGPRWAAAWVERPPQRWGRHRGVRRVARAVRRRVGGGQHHDAAQRLEPGVLWPALLGAADRGANAGGQPGRRPAARGAHPLRHAAEPSRPPAPPPPPPSMGGHGPDADRVRATRRLIRRPTRDMGDVSGQWRPAGAVQPNWRRCRQQSLPPPTR